VKNKQPQLLALALSIVFIVSSNFAYCQDEELVKADTTKRIYKAKGFHAGVYVGAFWANNNSASIYDGYGLDENGDRNTFENSLLKYQIINNLGGGLTGDDQIAKLLNVSHADWTFTQSDMPTNLKYTTTYMVGLNTRYQINKKASILLNINGSKLIVNGKFTVSLLNQTSGGLQNQGKQAQFTITGAEQRLMFNLGYQRIIGNHPKLNFLVEGGLNIIMSKAQKNTAYLNTELNNGANNLQVDLLGLYSQAPYNMYSNKYLVGVGIGAIGGLGLHLTINPKYTIQLLYNPSYDRVPIGFNPKFKLQNAVGLRFYFNLS
jgi:hypothetical protein